MLSREFLLERGYCCGHGCLMCPYEPKHKKGNTMTSVIDEKKLVRLERRLKKLEAKVKDFMENWGPDVQKRRDERDARWDEMVRVLTIQKMRNETK